MSGRVFGVFAFLCITNLPLRAASFDHTVFDAILHKYVNDEGLVNYQAIRSEAARDLNDYLSLLSSANLEGLSYEEKLAFWINAYNALMIKNIINHPELKKVSDNFGLFDLPFKIAGGQYTLNDIESRIIRGKTNSKNKQGPSPGVTLEKFDPRIHFALVCAAISCPKLQNFAYTQSNIEKTLQSAAIRFAALPKHVAVVKGRLRLSSLLKWYQEDFNKVGGVPVYLTSLLKFTHGQDAPEIERLLKTKFDKADYEYDWTVNDIKNAGK